MCSSRCTSLSGSDNGVSVRAMAEASRCRICVVPCKTTGSDVRGTPGSTRWIRQARCLKFSARFTLPDSGGRAGSRSRVTSSTSGSIVPSSAAKELLQQLGKKAFRGSIAFGRFVEQQLFDLCTICLCLSLCAAHGPVHSATEHRRVLLQATHMLSCLHVRACNRNEQHRCPAIGPLPNAILTSDTMAHIPKALPTCLIAIQTRSCRRRFVVRHRLCLGSTARAVVRFRMMLNDNWKLGRPTMVEVADADVCE
mmetsp:Transcript_5419/g.20492  ORF Transcript_5419/g.20492 Transcript_5419/m.20492 type:complete len:253 (+) Transcript_5419:456-1214(+)